MPFGSVEAFQAMDSMHRCEISSFSDQGARSGEEQVRRTEMESFHEGKTREERKDSVSATRLGGRPPGGRWSASISRYWEAHRRAATLAVVIVTETP